MAIRLSEVFVEIGARTTKFNKGIAKASRGLKNFGRNIKNFSQQNKLELAAFSAAGVIAFGRLLSAAGDFDSKMREVRAVSLATEEQFQRLSDTAKTLGSTTQFSAAQAADGMRFLAKAGFDAEEVLAAIPGTLELAAAASLELANAADIVSNVLTGFSFEVEQLGRVNDVLSKAFTSSNTDLVQLGQAMKFAGPTAAGFRQDFEEVVAVLGTFGNAGIQASMAGTALRGALVRLANPSREAGDIIKDLGIKVFDSEGQMRSFVDILEDFEKSGASAAQIMQIFGQRAGPAIQAALSQGTASIREFSAMLKDSAGTAADIAAAKMAGLKGATLEMTSAFEGLQIAIAESGLLEFASKLARGLAGVFRELTVLPPEILAFGTGLSGIVTIGAGVLSLLGFMAAALAAVKIAFFGAATGAVVANTTAATFSVTMGAATATTASFGATLALLSGPILLVGAIIAGLTVAFFKYRTAVTEAADAGEAFASQQKTLAQRQREGFVIAKKFNGVTRAQIKGMGNQSIVVRELSRGIRGLATSLGLAQEAGSRKRIQVQIDNLKALRDQAIANGKAQLEAETSKNEALIALEEFHTQRKAELEDERLNKSIETLLIQRVNEAETLAARMIAEENLAEFRKSKGLEVFTFQQQLAIRTGALLKEQFGSVVVALTKGQKTFAQAAKGTLRQTTDFILKQLAIQLAQETAATIKRIAMARAVASTRAIAAEAGKGLIGIVTATIAVAAFSALLSRFAKFEHGGRVRGTGGVDSVPALLTPGEDVLTPGTLPALLAHRAPAPPIRSMPSMAGLTIRSIVIQNPIVDSDERLEELGDRVGEMILDRVMLQIQPA